MMVVMMNDDTCSVRYNKNLVKYISTFTLAHLPTYLPTQHFFSHLFFIFLNFSPSPSPSTSQTPLSIHPIINHCPSLLTPPFFFFPFLFLRLSPLNLFVMKIDHTFCPAPAPTPYSLRISLFPSIFFWHFHSSLPLLISSLPHSSLTSSLPLPLLHHCRHCRPNLPPEPKPNKPNKQTKKTTQLNFLIDCIYKNPEASFPPPLKKSDVVIEFSLQTPQPLFFLSLSLLRMGGGEDECILDFFRRGGGARKEKRLCDIL